MFRLVTVNIPAPKFLLMCDNSHCAVSTFTDVTGKTQDEQNSAAATFVAQSQLEGWLVGLTGSYCPQCEKKRREVRRVQETTAKVAAESKRLVQLASPLQQRMAEQVVRPIFLADGKGATVKL